MKESAANVIHLEDEAPMTRSFEDYFRAMVRNEVQAELKRMGVSALTRRQMRQSKGMSITTLAKRAQVEPGYISMLELGKIKNIGSRDAGGLVRIAEWLGVSTGEYVRAGIDA